MLPNRVVNSPPIILRISLDFDGTSSALAKRNTRIDTGNVVGVTAVEAGL